MLFIVGLGLGDEKDVTIKGREAIDSCSKIFLEAYTSILGVGKERLVSDTTDITSEFIIKEAFYGKEIVVADRELVESGCEAILAPAKEERVAFLVVGDPFGATTHMDLYLRAKERGIEVQVVHNASIMNAIGRCGLQLYNFGPAVSIVFFEDNWRPDSFYDKIALNKKNGQHTLCLLDIKVKEVSLANMMKGKMIYEAPRFMSVNRCIEQLLEVEEKRKEGVYGQDTPCIGLARLGHEDQKIVSGTMSELLNVDFGTPLHSFIIPGEMHFIEKDCFDHFRENKQTSS
ncbi:diphthamide biosynthesis protein 5 [Planoprotostelium fungivorum]|uniref:diphthine methyl ester synthase n=1 Tax=Planoprotostelium fungivorum TaxID=1890364 RepID=A0A2P6NJM8_9EUKA|nr:diphthamide biosynthesis protein 5 [Planoprotostelium fungivorum]